MLNKTEREIKSERVAIKTRLLNYEKYTRTLFAFSGKETIKIPVTILTVTIPTHYTTLQKMCLCPIIYYISFLFIYSTVKENYQNFLIVWLL